jgi:hypothetical protein
MTAARIKASGMGLAGDVFEGDAEIVARALWATHERLAPDFPRRVLDVAAGVPWPSLPGEARALLIEVARQLLIEGRIRAR